ncbi:MAG TPA: hypothetical protein VJ692_04710, partial [Nitrospiraceae bacterium]|nr:hypothetical protein [Nitrospiraceae bacterium]
MPRNMIMDLSSPADLAQTVHNRRVFDWRDGLVFAPLSAAGLLAIAYFLSDWMRLPAWHSYPAMMVLLTILIAVVLFNNQGRWFLLPMMKRPEPMPIRSAWRVGVVTTFVGGAESLDMLEETVAALRAMEYPHETWVLDESDDPDVTALCRRLGAQHFSRKSLRHYHAERGVFQSHSKHGNYNAWLYDIGFERYDIISAFDPDHIPARTFLTEVLGYFHDPRIGYVQAAQAYYNQQA